MAVNLWLGSGEEEYDERELAVSTLTPSDFSAAILESIQRLWEHDERPGACLTIYDGPIYDGHVLFALATTSTRSQSPVA